METEGEAEEQNTSGQKQVLLWSALYMTICKIFDISTVMLKTQMFLSIDVSSMLERQHIWIIGSSANKHYNDAYIS